MSNPGQFLAAFNLLQKIKVERRELPRTRSQPRAAPEPSKHDASLRKTPCFQPSPSLLQDTKPHKPGHGSQHPKIFHFATLEAAKLLFRRGCTPSTRSLHRVFHRENLGKAAVFPHSPAAPSKPALPSGKNRPAESLPPGRGSPKAPRSWAGGETRGWRRSRKHQAENPPFLPDTSRHPPPLPLSPSDALEGPSRVLRPPLPGLQHPPHRHPPAAAFCSSHTSFSAITGVPLARLRPSGWVLPL